MADFNTSSPRISSISEFYGLLGVGVDNTGKLLDPSVLLTLFVETDPIFTASPSAGITSALIQDWNTAYSWGDHSLAGYLTSTPPQTITINVPTGLSGTSAPGAITITLADGYTIPTLAQLSSYLTSETDPIFTASPSAGITALLIGDWNTAYGWGNHATQGYLKSFTETDPIFSASPSAGITAGNITTWNAKEPTIALGTTGQYWRGDKSWQTLDKATVGLANVDNTSDLNKPISTATQAALDLKQNILGYTPENTTNKSTTLGTSDTLYPTQNAVKTYIDTGLSAKQNTLTFGSLTEATSAVLTITGGTGAVVGSGLTIQVKQSSSTQSGFLTSADWNRFNNKQSALGYTPLNKAGDTLSSTNGSGFVGYPAQSATPSTPSSGFRAFADSSNRLSWIGANGFKGAFDGTANTADRAYTLQDKSGTIAHTSDLLTLANGTTINGVCYIVQSSKPTTRPDSSALQVGDRWINPSTNIDGFWNGVNFLSIDRQIYQFNSSGTTGSPIVVTTSTTTNRTLYVPRNTWIEDIVWDIFSFTGADASNYITSDIQLYNQGLATRYLLPTPWYDTRNCVSNAIVGTTSVTINTIPSNGRASSITLSATSTLVGAANAYIGVALRTRSIL